ncbi:hypothetical protein [Halobacillus sp. A5]|uniref:hypothetical protein n=1 Tax=Halobacillus sp. A5 TaxID=2880263 RepID=UPI0020A664A1|nr:hypothetical protein [Halobacillus sp. A5]MCP3028767.1 hypothetical protein [Halobacillus sp. A5]
MKALKLEAETIQVSVYSDIILEILYTHKELSINKILVFAYLIKKERFFPKKIYTAKNSQDIIYKCVSQISGDFEGYCNSIEYILKAIHLLNTKKIVVVRDNWISLCAHKSVSETIYKESNFITKAIEASKCMTEKQFMKEVIHNV